MKKSRHSEEQIINILKEAEAGLAVAELCRKYGISDQTYYNWKARYGGMTVSDARKMKKVKKIGGLFKDHSINYEVVDAELKTLSRESQGHLLSEAGRIRNRIAS